MTFLKIYFIDYAITVFPFFSPLYSLQPCTRLPPSFPHLSSHPNEILEDRFEKSKEFYALNETEW